MYWHMACTQHVTEMFSKDADGAAAGENVALESGLIHCQSLWKSLSHYETLVLWMITSEKAWHVHRQGLKCSQFCSLNCCHSITTEADGGLHHVSITPLKAKCLSCGWLNASAAGMLSIFVQRDVWWNKYQGHIWTDTKIHRALILTSN